jgi:hypothetical protein
MVTVTNLSREVDRFELEVTDINPAWYRFDWSEILLYPDPPGNQGTVYLQIIIPADALPTTYTPILQAQSGNQAGQVTPFPFRLIVNKPEAQGVEVLLTPPTQETKEKQVNYQLNLRNASSKPTTVNLRVEQPNSISTAFFNFEKSKVYELAPNGVINTILQMRPRKRNWVSAPRQHLFRVNADNVLNPAQGELNQTAALPWLRNILLTPLIFIPLLILPLVVSALLIWWLFPKDTSATLVFPVASCFEYTPPVQANLLVRNGATDVVVQKPGATEPEVLISEPANLPGLFYKLLSVSPDGQKLVYVTARNTGMQGAELILVQINSRASSKLATLTDPLWPARPVWSGDSNKLAYITLRDQALQMWSIDLATDRRPKTLGSSRDLAPYLTPNIFYGNSPRSPFCWSNDNATRLIIENSPTSQVEVVANTGQFIRRNARPPRAPTPITATTPVTAFEYEDEPLAQRINLRLQQQPISPTPTTGLPPLTTDSPCSVITYSMNDPRWRYEQIRSKQLTGTNPTIADGGCAIATAAMIFNFNGLPDNPLEISRCLAEDATPWNWNVTVSKCTRGAINPPNERAFSWQNLNNTLLQGQPVIVGLLSPQYGIHYVVVTGGGGNIAAFYKVNDPWDGSSYKTLADFFNVGYLPYTMVSFTGTNAPTCGSFNEPQAPREFVVNSPVDGGIYSQATDFRYTSTLTGTPRANLRRLSTGAFQGTPGNQPGSTTIGTSRLINNNEPVAEQGAYQLLVETGSTEIPLREIRFVVDLSPPQVEAIVNLTPVNTNPGGNLTPTPSPTPTSAGPVTIDFRAFDNLSGIAAVRYQLTNVTSDFVNYLDPSGTRPIVVETPGDYTLIYQAIDGAGRTSQTSTYRFVIVSSTGVDTNATATAGAAFNATAAAQSQATINANLTAAVLTQQAINAAQNQPTVNNNPGGSSGGSSGSSGGSSGGGSSGGGVQAPTPAPPPTTPAPTPTLPPALLAANPAAINIDPTQQQTAIQLQNTGGTPADWTLTPLTDPLVQYIQLGATSGTVPPGGTAVLPVQVTGFNLTGQPIAANVVLSYRNGQATLNIPVTIVAQPAPTVKFLSPVASTQLVTSSIDIKLEVTTAGLAKPTRATFTAKYIGAGETAISEKPITGEATPDNAWTVKWDVSALPPQQNIEINGKICYSADETTCRAITPGVTGIILPVPSATINLAQDTATGDVTLTAIVAPGAVKVEQIVYTATYKTNPADPVAQPQAFAVAERANVGNNFTLKLSTANIPPQQGIKIDARICWKADDASCALLASQSKTFNIDAPVLTINPLAAPAADPQDLPATFSISGTVQKLFNSTAQIYVTYEYIAVAGTTTKVAGEVTVKPTLAAGNGTWQVDITNLATAPAQAITFAAKVCYDPAKTLCFPIPAPTVQGTIKDISVQITPPGSPDLTAPVQLVVVPSSKTRVASARFFVTFDGDTQKDKLVPNLTANAANNFTVTFDSVALGLKPGQAIKVKAQACNSTGTCSTTFSNELTLNIPQTTLENVQVVPGSGTITPTLSTAVQVQATLKGRVPSSLSYLLIYRNPPGATNTISTVIGSSAGNLVLDQPTTTSLNSNNAPNLAPQGNLSLVPRLCWSGSLSSGCVELAPVFTGFAVAPPVVTNIFVNGSTPFTQPYLAIPYDNNTITTTSTLVITPTVSITGTNVAGVKWKLDIQPPGTFVPVTSTLISAANGQSTFPISLDLNALKTAVGGDLSAVVSFTVVILPVWRSNDGTLVVDFDTPESRKTLNLKFVPFSAAQMGRGTLPAVNLPAPNVSDATMFTRQTNFSGTVPDAAVQRVIFDFRGIGVNFGTTVSFSRSVTVTGNNWSYLWDHTIDKMIPQSGITMTWRYCVTAAPDDSGCLPANMQFSNGLPRFSLNLAGVRFTSTDLTSGSINRFFNSNFTANVQVSVPNLITSVGQLRFYAYSTTFTNTKVLLGKYSDVVTGTPANNFTWQIPVYFPNDDVGSPPTGTQTVNNLSTIASDRKITMGVQYCVSNPNPTFDLNDPLCSDWNGELLEQIDPTPSSQPANQWRARISGNMNLIVNWLSYVSAPDSSAPFVETDPHNYIVQQSDKPTRTLRIKVTPIISATNPITVSAVTFRAQNGVNFLPVDSGGVASLIPMSTIYSRTWTVRGPVIGTLPDSGTITPTVNVTNRPIRIVATVSYNLASGSDANNAFVTTGGKTDGFPPPAAPVSNPALASSPSPSPSITPSPSPSPTATGVPTFTPTFAPSATATIIATATTGITPSPTAVTPTFAPTATATPTNTPPPSPSPTIPPTPLPTLAPTPTPST